MLLHTCTVFVLMALCRNLVFAENSTTPTTTTTTNPIEESTTESTQCSSETEFLFPTSSSAASFRFKSYHFELTKGVCQPDNFRQACYFINGQYPGPPIFVNQHDFLEVTVVNRLTVPTAIHFHGILQTHTIEADGVPHVTQDPILPNETYVYRMQIGPQTGTYMYHGHLDLDLVWLHGPMIIRDNPAYWAALGPAYQYDPGHEHIFQLETIYHEPLEKLVYDIINEGNDDPYISSLAINGMSFGHWNTTQNETESELHGIAPAPGYSVLSVVPGRRYRFRIINISAGSFFRFHIDNHNLTIVEVDGIVVDPVETTHLEINSGQRFSVLVTMNNTLDNYWVSCELAEGAGEGGPSNGKAILHYNGAQDPTPLRKQLFLEETSGWEATLDKWILPKIRPNQNYTDTQVYPVPREANQRILVDMYFRTTDGPPRFLINGHHYVPPNDTYLRRVREGVDVSANDTHVFKITEGEVIDLVFQNRVDDTGGCDQHPIHLHGHSFWVLQQGENEVNMTSLPHELDEAAKKENLEFRDTFTLFPNQSPENSTSGLGCGWAVIRFKADNPGLWLVHCHVTSHMLLGKLFTLYEVNPHNPRLINE